jgi:hypothetical protein
LIAGVGERLPCDLWSPADLPASPRRHRRPGQGRQLIPRPARERRRAHRLATAAPGRPQPTGSPSICLVIGGARRPGRGGGRWRRGAARGRGAGASPWLCLAHALSARFVRWTPNSCAGPVPAQGLVTAPSLIPAPGLVTALGLIPAPSLIRVPGAWFSSRRRLRNSRHHLRRLHPTRVRAWLCCGR